MAPPRKPDKSKRREDARISSEEETGVAVYTNKPGSRRNTGNDHHKTVINAIILEYLEKCGLEQTYKLLLKEGKQKHMRFPKSLTEPTFKTSKFGPKHGEELFKFYDAMDGDGVLDIWEQFLGAEEPSSELLRTTMMLRVYVASIPFHLKQNSGAKQIALNDLQIFLSKNSEELTKDEVCVPLFAFSFIRDPQTNPAFRVVFTKEWLTNLRETVQNILRAHYAKHCLQGSPNCDLTQIYFNYVDVYGEPSKSGPRQKLYRKPAEALADPRKRSMVPVEQYLEAQTRINNLQDHMNCLKQCLLYERYQYYKLLQWTSQLTQAWRDVIQGVAKNGEEITKLYSIFPQLGPIPKSSVSTTVPDDEEDDVDEPEVINSRSISFPDDQTPRSSTGSESGDEDTTSPTEPKQRQQSAHDNSESDSDFSDVETDGIEDSDSCSESIQSEENELAAVAAARAKSAGKYSKQNSTAALECDPLAFDPPKTPEELPTDEPGITDVCVENIVYFHQADVQSPSDTSARSSTRLTMSPGSQRRTSANSTARNSLTRTSQGIRAQTYEVTPRNAGSITSLYIPGSIQVGCETPKILTPKSRPGVPRAAAQPQMAIGVNLNQETVELQSPRVRMLQLDDHIPAVMEQKPYVPVPRASCPARPGVFSAPSSELRLINDFPFSGGIPSPRIEDFTEALPPKKELPALNEKGSTTFMASVMAVIPPDPSRCYEKSQGDSLTNNVGPVPRQRKNSLPTVSNVNPNLDKALKSNMSTPTKKVPSQTKVEPSKKPSNTNINVGVRKITAPVYGRVVPKGSRSGEALGNGNLKKK